MVVTADDEPVPAAGSPAAAAPAGSPAAAKPEDPGSLRLARRVARQLATETGARSAFVGGSLAVGLGNDASDVDIYLIGPDLPLRRERLLVGPHWFDVHQLGFERLATLIRQVNSADPGTENMTGTVSEADLSLAVRLNVAKAAVTEPDLNDLLATLDNGHLARLMIRRWNASAFNALEDLSGQRKSGDPDAAVLCARSALLAAGKAVAAACGDLHDGLKWVFHQLERAAPAGFPLADFRSLTRCDPLSAGNRLGQLTRMTQTFMVVTSVLGLQSASLDKWPAWLPGTGPLCRAAGLYPSSAGASLKVIEPGTRLLKMRWDVALVWGLADGTHEAELVAQAGRLRDCGPVYRDLTPDRCRVILAQLAEAGAITATAG